MDEIDLHQRFVECLNTSIPNRTVLLNFVSETLMIEKDSASRRLNNKVRFSVNEMGLLAQILGISLDALSQPVPMRTLTFEMEYPHVFTSLNVVTNMLEEAVNRHHRIIEEPTDMLTIFDSFPVEFLMPYKELFKFIYFKWGYYFVNDYEFQNYSNWEVPSRIVELNNDLMRIYRGYKSSVYIWDNPTTRNLLQDIKYMSNIGVMTIEDMHMIKADIHKMLYDLEEVAGGFGIDGMTLPIPEFYVSSVNIGMTLSYFKGVRKCYSLFKTYFVHSYVSENETFCKNVYSWIKQMKQVSTLISGSGEKDRILFFKEQHRLVDMI